MKIIRSVCILILLALSFTFMCSADEYASKSSIENGFFTFSSSTVTDEKDLLQQLKDRISFFTDPDTELLGVKINEFILPNENGDDGKFTFTCEMSQGQLHFTLRKSGVILNENASLILKANNTSVFSGDSLTLTANATELQGKKYQWFESYTAERSGSLIASTNDGEFSFSASGTGTRYYYCVYGDMISNIVKVETMKPFVPAKDIALDTTEFTVGKTTQLNALITPQDATMSDIEWSVVSGSVDLFYNRITPRAPGQFSIQATLKNSIDGKTVLTRIFTLFAKEDTSVSEDVTKQLDVPALSKIVSAAVTGKNVSDISITSLSTITSDKLFAASGISGKYDMLTSAYLVKDDSSKITNLSINIGSEHAEDEITVIYGDKNGSVFTHPTVVLQNGDITIPPDSLQFIVIAEKKSFFDISMLFITAPVLPLILTIIFKAVCKKNSSDS